jgi:hypothetical protein
LVDTDRADRLDEAADQWRLLHGGLAAGETVLLTVRSGSMLPCLPVGAKIEIAAVDGRECRVGDVVVFRRGDRLIAHRLLFGWGHEPGSWFLERGDGVSPAGLIRARTILGKVVALHRADGRQQRLDCSDALTDNLRRARRSLRQYLLAGATAPLRKARQWLRRISTGSR